MKARLLLITLFVCTSVVFAQQEVTSIEKPKHEFAFSIGDNLNSTALNYNDAVGYGSYTFSYHYAINNWFLLGSCINISSINREYSGFDTKYSIAPSLRFLYLNKPNVALYSGFSIGWGFHTNDEEDGVSSFGQLTFLGFSYGKKFFIGGEIGIGNKGLFCLNVGYRM